MDATGAVVFLPREGSGASLMLEDLLFDPAALWLTEALKSAGVERFFVVCHTDDREKAEACFPEGTRFVTGGSENAVEQLVAFLGELDGKAIVVMRPVLLSEQNAKGLFDEQWGGPLECEDTGVCRIDAQTLAQALGEGTGLEDALREKADKPNGRSICTRTPTSCAPAPRPGWRRSSPPATSAPAV